MKRRAVLVEGIRALGADRKRARSSRSKTTVTFADGTVATLDLSDAREKVWAEVLGSLKDRRKPAYVELDLSTGRISSLLLPRAVSVVDVREPIRGGDLQIEFVESHAFHFLRRTHERFEEMRKVLETAMRTRGRLLVTDSVDGAELVDVRWAEGAPNGRS